MSAHSILALGFMILTAAFWVLIARIDRRRSRARFAWWMAEMTALMVLAALAEHWMRVA